MPNVIPSGDCGNSPKNLFLETLTIAFVTGDTALVVARVTDDITWFRIGTEIIRGIPAFIEAFAAQAKDSVAEVVIHHAISHGKTGAVNGTIKLDNGRTIAFCHFYEFANAKATSVREFKSYVLDG